MKQTPGVPRRTALAIAAASAGLTLAVTATIATGLGLIVPPAPVAPPSTGHEQPIQQPHVTITGDALASIPTDSIGQPATAGITRQTTRIDEARSTRRERDDDDHRGKRLRRSAPGDTATARSTNQVVSRARHEEDDHD